MASYRGKISQILAMTKEDELLSEIGKFEDALIDELEPLRAELAKDLRTNEVAQIQDHMTYIESWRERVCRYFSLSVTYVSHCKSDHFILPKEKGKTEFDREAYQKRLLAGFLGIQAWLEGILDSIDSRVNEAKLLLRFDEPGNFGGRRHEPMRRPAYN